MKVVELEAQKQQIQAEIAEAETTLERMREGLNELNNIQEEKSKVVEQAKKTHARSAKVLDQALKEIGLKVVYMVLRFNGLVFITFFFARTMKSRSWLLNGRHHIASVDLKMSGYLYSKATWKMSPWRRWSH